MKIRVLWLQERLLCALVLAVATPSGIALGVEELCGVVAAKLTAAVPWSDLRARTDSAFPGAELVVAHTGDGALLRCDFQRLEAAATRGGLWLSSTATNATHQRFSVLATAVGRTAEYGVRWQSGAATPLCSGDALSFPPGSKLLANSGTVSI